MTVVKISWNSAAQELVLTNNIPLCRNNNVWILRSSALRRARRLDDMAGDSKSKLFSGGQWPFNPFYDGTYFVKFHIVTKCRRSNADESKSGFSSPPKIEVVVFSFAQFWCWVRSNSKKCVLLEFHSYPAGNQWHCQITVTTKEFSYNSTVEIEDWYLLKSHLRLCWIFKCGPPFSIGCWSFSRLLLQAMIM